ncbi:hypothetical protein [Streptomyces sp. NPDC096012]|uniref:hypothetical protein n=1 Tax=Streptomyces sp. NPDC096012 TaxID=3155684 RepID=UPI003369EE11
MSLARREISRHKWDSLKCGCGRSAGHLVKVLESAIDGAADAFRALDGCAITQSILKEPAPAVCAVLMAMIADGLNTNQIDEAAWLLLWFASAEEDGDSVESGFYWRCFETIRDGLWSIYREFQKSSRESVSNAYLNDVLEIVEWDSSRLAYYRSLP